ncbi:unnamed protein product [Choristocarpus tenellus]
MNSTHHPSTNHYSIRALAYPGGIGLERYKTIFMGSRLSTRLLGEDSLYGSSYNESASIIDSERGESASFSSAECTGNKVPTGEEEGGGLGGGGAPDNICRTQDVQSRERKQAGEQHGRRHQKRRRQQEGWQGSESDGGTSSRQDSSIDIVEHFAWRMEEARETWSFRLDSLLEMWQSSRLRGAIGAVSSGGSGQGITRRWGWEAGGAVGRDRILRVTFGLLVRMYAYEDTLGDLLKVASSEPSCLEFFAPQLATFLVWNSYYTGGQLEAWLLNRCSENLYFAHALEFQLRAFCLPPSKLVDSVSIPSTGIGGDRVGDSDTSGKNSGGNGALEGHASNTNEVWGGGDEIIIDQRGIKALKRLLVEIGECGQKAAYRMVRDVGGTEAIQTEEGLDMEESGQLKDENVNLYTDTPSFLARLTGMSRSLRTLPKEERTKGLRDQLSAIAMECFGSVRGESSLREGYGIPSDHSGGDFASRDRFGIEELGGTGVGTEEGSKRLQETKAEDNKLGGGHEQLIYIPLGNRRHRVVNVHPSESFAFSTKERVPCFVCFEVVDAPIQKLLAGGAGRGKGEGDRDGEGATAEQGQGGNWRWQWLQEHLPRPAPSVRIHKTIRLPGGREWTLSVGSRDVTDSPAGGTVEEKESGEKVAVEAMARVSVGGGQFDWGNQGKGAEGKVRGEGGRAWAGSVDRSAYGSDDYSLLAGDEDEELGMGLVEGEARDHGDGMGVGTVAGTISPDAQIGEPLLGKVLPIRSDQRGMSGEGSGRDKNNSSGQEMEGSGEEGSGVGEERWGKEEYSWPKDLFNERWEDKSARIRRWVLVV